MIAARVAATALAAAWLFIQAGCGPLSVPSTTQIKVALIGYLSATPGQDNPGPRALRQAMGELGYIDGENFRIEARWAGDLDGADLEERLRQSAAELVNLPVDLIVTYGPGVRIARDLTTSIPIVMHNHRDPVGLGVINSLARPGGNVTGVASGEGLSAKQVELLKELVPGASRVGLVWYRRAATQPVWDEALRGANRLGVQLVSLEVRGPDDLDGAFSNARHQVDALVATGDDFVHGGGLDGQNRYYERGIKSGVPTLWEDTRAVRAGGGLIAVAPDQSDNIRRAASYVDRILRGARPGDLPVERPTRYDVVVNVTTARAMGLEISPTLAAQVTEWVQ
jgi:putative ABC transport system substrate-binding protein